MTLGLQDMARVMIAHKKASKEFWVDAIVTATYLRSRVTCQAPPTNTLPFEPRLSGEPDVALIRGFGSLCSYHSR